MVFPVISISCAPSADKFLPTLTMRLFLIRISPPSITSVPLEVIIRAFFNRIDDSGISLLTVTSIDNSIGLNFGSFFFSSFLSFDSSSSLSESSSFEPSSSPSSFSSAFFLASSFFFSSSIFFACFTLSAKASASSKS